MIQLFQIEAEVPVEQLLQLLLETLGLEFREAGAVWNAESYGGSSFELSRESAKTYALRVQHDRTHRLFADQEKSFCRADAFPEWIPAALSRSGVRCVFREVVTQKGPGDPDPE
jgi:hypothetical protein